MNLEQVEEELKIKQENFRHIKRVRNSRKRGENAKSVDYNANNLKNSQF